MDKGQNVGREEEATQTKVLTIKSCFLFFFFSFCSESATTEDIGASS